MKNQAESFTGVKIEPIKTEVPLPLEMNQLNDCGPLCLQMVLLADHKTIDGEISLGGLRAKLDKSPQEFVDVGRLCKALKEAGYDVSYFSDSNIDIESIANNDPETAFDKWDSGVAGVIDGFRGFPLDVYKQKIHQSAKWSLREENAGILSKKNLSIKEISDFLREGRRVIVPVMAGAHYVVVVGVDNERIFYNDPATGEVPAEKSMTHTEFIKYWSERRETRDAIVANPSKNQERESVKIKIATPEDWQEYRDLRLEAINGEFKEMFGSTPEMVEAETKRTEGEWRQDLSRDDMFVVLSRTGSQAVGMARAVEKEKGVWKTNTGYVKKEFQNRKIGPRMFNERLDEMCRRGGTKAIMMVKAENEHSIHVCEGVGFKKISAEPEVIILPNGREFKFYRMELDLTTRPLPGHK